MNRPPIPDDGLPQLFGDDFARNPYPTYDALRVAGPVAWAELTPGVYGMVVTRHAAAVELLGNTHAFTRDTRHWTDFTAGRVPPTSPLLGIMGWRASLLFADGADHARLYRPLRDSLARIPAWDLEAITTRAANAVIDDIAPTGRADLVAQFAQLTPLMAFAELLGCPPDTTQRMTSAAVKIIDADAEAAQGAAELFAYLGELVQLKAEQPGRDLATWMLHHPEGLDPQEVVSNLYDLVGAGNTTTPNWIAQSLRLLLKDDPYAGDLTGGSVTVRRAMEKALWEFSPLATFTFHIARHATVLHGCEIPAGYPVLISHAACNTDPTLPPNLGYDSRAHLAFSAGTHRCPAPTQGAIITETAITTLFDRLWDMELTDDEPIPNRPGLFHQCPAYLNVAFQPRTNAVATPGGTS